MGMLLRIAWRNIGRGWRRSAVVITAVAVGLWGCLLLLGWTKGMFYQMADNAIRIQLAHLTVSAEGYNANPGTRINLGDYDLVAELAQGWDGASASPRLRGEGLVRTARKSVQAMIVGVVPEAEAGVSVIPHLMVEGTFLESEAGGRRRSRLPRPWRSARPWRSGWASSWGTKSCCRSPGTPVSAPSACAGCSAPAPPSSTSGRPFCASRTPSDSTSSRDV
jgi:hypothetical protein